MLHRDPTTRAFIAVALAVAATCMGADPALGQNLSLEIMPVAEEVPAGSDIVFLVTLTNREDRTVSVPPVSGIGETLVCRLTELNGRLLSRNYTHEELDNDHEVEPRAGPHVEPLARGARDEGYYRIRMPRRVLSSAVLVKADYGFGANATLSSSRIVRVRALGPHDISELAGWLGSRDAATKATLDTLLVLSATGTSGWSSRERLREILRDVFAANLSRQVSVMALALLCDLCYPSVEGAPTSDRGNMRRDFESCFETMTRGKCEFLVDNFRRSLKYEYLTHAIGRRSLEDILSLTVVEPLEEPRGEEPEETGRKKSIGSFIWLPVGICAFVIAMTCAVVFLLRRRLRQPPLSGNG